MREQLTVFIRRESYQIEALTVSNLLFVLISSLYPLEQYSLTWMLDTVSYVLKIVGLPLIVAQLFLSFFSDNLPYEYISPGQDVHVSFQNN